MFMHDEHWAKDWPESRPKSDWRSELIVPKSVSRRNKPKPDDLTLLKTSFSHPECAASENSKIATSVPERFSISSFIYSENSESFEVYERAKDGLLDSDELSCVDNLKHPASADSGRRWPSEKQKRKEIFEDMVKGILYSDKYIVGPACQ